MFEGIERGWNLIKASIRVFNHHPSFIIPILVVWVIYGSVILYLDYGLNWDLFTPAQTLLIIIGAIFLFAFLLSFSCSTLLGLIQQIESEEKASLSKAFSHTKAHLTEFATGFVLTTLAATVLYLPPAILFYLSDELRIDFPNWLWIICIIYIAFAWSYTIYLEQMFGAELYLWNMRWEREIMKNPEKNLEYLTAGLKSVEKPSLLDETPDLLEK